MVGVAAIGAKDLVVHPLGCLGGGGAGARAGMAGLGGATATAADSLEHGLRALFQLLTFSLFAFFTPATHPPPPV